MIIGHGLMVQFGLISYSKFKVLERYDYVVHIKYIENFLDKPNIIKRDIQDILMHTSEPYSTREDT